MSSKNVFKELVSSVTLGLGLLCLKNECMASTLE